MINLFSYLGNIYIDTFLGLEVKGFSDQIFWYLVRTTGIVSVFTLSSSIALGFLTSSRMLGPKPSIPWLIDLHRFLSSITMILILLHLIGLWADNFTSFSLADLLIPFQSDFLKKQNAITFGIIAFWMIVIVEMTSLIKTKLNTKIWHTVHLLSVPAVVLSILHGYKIGSDADNPVLIGITTTAITALSLLIIVRLLIKARNSAEF